VEVHSESSIPESYQLALTFVKEESAATPGENRSQAIISKLKIGDEEGFLADALFTPAFQQALIDKIAANEAINLPDSR
jgi:maltose alpha-D-glucosyltransferase/alpha-amylase